METVQVRVLLIVLRVYMAPVTRIWIREVFLKEPLVWMELEAVEDVGEAQAAGQAMAAVHPVGEVHLLLAEVANLES